MFNCVLYIACLPCSVENTGLLPRIFAMGKDTIGNGVGARGAHGGKPNKEMRKPVKTVLSCLHITKLGHCYSFPSSKMPGVGETESIIIYFPLN